MVTVFESIELSCVCELVKKTLGVLFQIDGPLTCRCVEGPLVKHFLTLIITNLLHYFFIAEEESAQCGKGWINGTDPNVCYKFTMTRLSWTGMLKKYLVT